MFLNIPKLKTELTISFDTDVPVYCESRNMDFLFKKNLVENKGTYRINFCNICNIEFCDWCCPVCNSHEITLAVRRVILPREAKLFVDRYYIRNGSEEFDSVTFRYLFNNEKSRFWLKLEDACRIEFNNRI